MKFSMSKLLVLVMVLISAVACDYSSQTMPFHEASLWISAIPNERISENSTITIYATDSLKSLIDTLRSSDKVFRFTPSIKGETHYSQSKTCVSFVPKPGSLKQGKRYKCHIDMAELTGIDSLKVFSFEFVVDKQYLKFCDVRTMIDPECRDSVIIEGKLKFSHKPGVKSFQPKLLSCGQKGAKVSLRSTPDDKCHAFRIKNVARQHESYILKLKYGELEGFPVAEHEIAIPGNEFQLLSSEHVEAEQPYVNLEFTEPLSEDQELEGLIALCDIDNVKIERNKTNVKVFYERNAFTEIILNISSMLRSENGKTLGYDIEEKFKQEVLPPAVEIPIKGTILPDGENLKLPFRAVNLAAVDVEVVKIYTDNVMTFLQTSDIDNSYGLRRTGRLIYRQTVRLDKDKSLNLNQWQNFSIDLKNLFRKERGAIYNIRILFRKAYSLYDKVKASDFKIVSGVTAADNQEWDKDRSYIYREAPDYDSDKYRWSEDDDPTKDSYYMNTCKMPEYNLMASDIGLIVKRAESGRLWCAVNDIMSSSPLKGIRVTAYNYQMRPIGSAYSNEQGFADFRVEGIPFILTATDGKSTTYLKTAKGNELSLSEFNVDGKKNKQGIKGFVYGERGMWRPGDDMYLTLIVEDKLKTLPANYPATMELYTPDDKLYQQHTMTNNVNGMYAFKAKTDEDAPTGVWHAKFKVGGQTFIHTVRVETIKPNRLKIKITSPEILRSGETAELGIDAQWLTGASGKGLKANLEMRTYNNPNPFKKYSKYLFLNPLYDLIESKQQIFSVNLDSLGKYKHSKVLPETKNAPGMLQANLIAKVAEPGGDESVTSTSVQYSTYRKYVGVDLGEKYFVAGEDMNIPVVCVDESGRPEDTELSYKVYHLDWDWWMEGSAQELSRYVQSQVAEIYESGKLKTVNGHSALALKIDVACRGRYLVYVHDPDGGHASGGIIYVTKPYWWSYSEKDDPTAATMLSFSLDKKSYEVGEYATVQLPSSANGRVLLSVENGTKVIKRIWVAASKDKETSYRIAVTKDMAPNFYVYATLLQPHSQTINDLPIRMYGVEGAEVVDKRTILKPEIIVADEVGPLKEFTIKVREKDRKPMSYTLAIVDEGLLDITSFKTPQPWRAMNQREALGVSTWDMYDDVIGAFSGKFRSILSVGGDGAIRIAAGKEKRFNPVVKFLGPFTLNSGTKTHRITLPMYVGSVRVMVVASKSGSYGSTDKTVKVTAPLMLLSTMPRSLSCGDRVKMPVNVFAMKGGISDVNVSVSVEGPLSVVGSSTKKVTFKGASEQLLEFDLACDNEKQGQAKVVITAAGGGHTAKETIYIDVKNPMPDIITSDFMSLNGHKQHTFKWPKMTNGDVRLSLSAVPMIDFNGVFSFVKSYPHECTEQLSSLAMFLLHAREYLSDEDKAWAEKTIPVIIKRIVSRQRFSGGFVYWSCLHDSNEWVTSMAGEVLIEAQRQGFFVHSQVLEKWKEYQKSAAKGYNHTAEGADDLQQAYRLYTLALSGENSVASMNKLRVSQNLSRQALLRLAAAYSLMGRKSVAINLCKRADNTSDTNLSYNVFRSPLRDKAMELDTWLLIGDEKRIFELSQEITSSFSAKNCNTQEMAYVSKVMSRMAEKTKKMTSEIMILENGKSKECIRNLDGIKNIPLNREGTSVTVENNGEGTIVANLTTRSKPSVKEPVKAESNGVFCDLCFTDLSGKRINIKSLKQGEEFLAKICVSKVRGATTSMALSFAVPSGWEIWNDRMLNSERQLANVDIRDDRVSWYFSIESGKEKNFTVRLRASYLGDFILPPTVCEDMYNTECRALSAPIRTSVVK